MERYNSIPTFLSEQLITYLGNKRKLIPYIEKEIQRICKFEEKERLSILEPFCGSGSVSRLLKLYSNHLVVNDLEWYATQLAKCYLSSPTQEEYDIICDTIKTLNEYFDSLEFKNSKNPLFVNYYAPKDDKHIEQGERVYYTRENALRLDWYREQIYTQYPEWLQQYLIAPLIVESSIHTNTSGTFNSFLKRDGIGHFGGSGEHALSRILGRIKLQVPVFSYMPDTKVEIRNMDANELCRSIDNEFDVVYLDPPYNKHAYGTFYFMLNIVGQWRPEFIPPDNLRGQPDDWMRSDYNSFVRCETAFRELIGSIRAKWIILSYNNEGILSEDRIMNILSSWGTVERREIQYPTYKACLNLDKRSKNVIEWLWIVKRY